MLCDPNPVFIINGLCFEVRFTYLKNLEGCAPLKIDEISVSYSSVGDSAGFASDTEPTISGIASILRKTLKLTSWYY